MRHAILCAAAIAAIACQAQVDLAKVPCARDENCPTDSYCSSGGCVALPAQHDVAVDAAPPVTAGKALKLAAHAAGGVLWSVQEAAGGSVDADGTYHSPATAGTYHVLATSTADPSKSATALVQVAPVPVRPAIQAAATVTSAKAGLTASVSSPQAGMAFAWTIAGGQITQGAATTAIAFTAGSGQSLTLTVRATNAAGDYAESSQAVALVPSASAAVALATTLTRGKAGLSATVPAQAGATYAWQVVGGVADPTTTSTNTVTFTAAASADTAQLRVSVTVTNAAGDASEGGATATLVDPVASFTLAAAPDVTAGKSYSATLPLQFSVSYSCTGTNATIGAISPIGVSVVVGFRPGAALQDYAVSCTGTNLAGDTASSTATGHVAPVPAKPAITAATSVSAGLGYTASAAPQAGITFRWSIDSGGTIPGPSANASVGYLAGAASASLKLTCTATNAAGDSDQSSTPAIPIVPRSAAITAPVTTVSQGKGGYAASGAAGYGSYDWSGSTGVTIASPSSASTSFTATSLTASLVLKVTNSLGDTDTKTLPLTVVALDPTITAASPVSQNLARQASVAAVSGSSYDWSTSSNVAFAGGISNTASITYTPLTAAGAVLRVKVTNSLGDSSPGSKPITVIPLDPTITAPASVSKDKSGYAASVSFNAGSTYDWSQSTGVAFSGATSGNQVSFTATSTAITLKCKVTNSLNDSLQGTSSPTVVPLDSTITSANPVSQNKTSTASVPAVAGSSYDWSASTGVQAGAGGTSAATFSFVPTTTANVVLKVTVTNSLGDSLPGQKPLTVDPLDPTMTSPTLVTQGKAGYRASVAYDAQSTYDWSVSTGISIAAGAAPNLITFTATQPTAVVRCKVTNALGDSLTGATTLTVIPLDPTITAFNGPISENVAGQRAWVAQVNGSTYDWTGSTGVRIDSGSLSSQITYTITSSSGATLKCHVVNSLNDGLDGFKTLTVVPLDPTITGAQVVTLNKPGRTASVQAFSNTTYDWSQSTGVTFDGGVIDQPTLRYTATAGQPMLKCTTKNANGDQQTGTYPLTAQPLDATLTSPTSVTQNKDGYSASVPTHASSSYDWSQSTNVVIAGNLTTSSSITFKVTASTATLKIVTSNGAGDSTSATQTLTVVPLDATISGASQVTQYQAGVIASVPNVTGSTYDWSASTGIRIEGASTAASISYTALSAGASLAVTVTNSLHDQASSTRPLTVVPAVNPPGINANTFVLTTGANPAAAYDFYDSNVVSYSWTYAVNGGGLQTSHAPGIVLSPASYPATTSLALDVANTAGDGPPTARSTAGIAQGPDGVQLIAGRLGGAGFADGVGTAGRLSGPNYVNGYSDLAAIPGSPGSFLFAQRSQAPGLQGLRKLLPVTSPATGYQIAATPAPITTSFNYQAFAPRTATSIFGCGYGYSEVYDFSAVPPAITRSDSVGCSASIASVGSDRYFTVMNNQIYKVVATTLPGTAQLIAGATVSGYTDAPAGPGTNARFNNPAGIWALDEFNLFVVDTGNQSVRLVHYDVPGAKWQVTTVAGLGPNGYGFVDGPASQAKLYAPRLITGADANNLFVVDSGNNAVRKLTNSSGWSVSTVATAAAMVAANPEAALQASAARGLALLDSTHLVVLQLANAINIDVTSGTGTTMVGKIGSSAPQVDAAAGPGLAAQVQGVVQLAQLGANDYVYIDASPPYHMWGTVRRLKLVGNNWTVTTLPSIPQVGVIPEPRGIASVGPFPSSSFVVLIHACTGYGNCVREPALVRYSTTDGVNWTTSLLADPSISGGYYSYLAMPDASTAYFYDGSNSIYQATAANGWAPQVISSGACLYGVAGGIAVGDANTLYVSGGYQGICRLTYAPGTNTWTQQSYPLPAGASDNVSSIALLDATHLLTGTTTGTMYLWTSSGGGWTASLFAGQPNQRMLAQGPMTAGSPPSFNLPSSMIAVGPGEVLLGDDAEAAIVDFRFAGFRP